MDSHLEFLVHCVILLFYITAGSKSAAETINSTDGLGDIGSVSNCVVITKDKNIAMKVDKLVSDGAKVIYIDFHFENYTGSLLKEDETSIYKPLSWVRTVGRHGRNLILLRPQYQIFSLNSLKYGTEMINVELTQMPANCLTTYNATVVARELREFLLYNFKTHNTSDPTEMGTLPNNEQICQMNIKSQLGSALFYYICCYKTLNGPTTCQELQSDKYITILFVCIYLSNFFAVMFSPLLIPAKLYRKKYETTSYEHRLNEPITLTVRKVSVKQTEEANIFPVSYFDEMVEFKETINNMDCDVTYDVKLSQINIVTEADKLLSSSSVPVGLLESLYAALVNCEVRHHSSIRDCCESNMFGSCLACKYKVPWYQFMQRIMHIVVYILIGSIWGIRLYFFYAFEESERLQRGKAAEKRNLPLTYTGNLTWFLTPLHELFLVCYCVFGVDFILFGVLYKHVKITLKRVMRKCFRDMMEISSGKAFGWSVQILLYPFKHCGVFGILFAWLYYIPAIPIVVCTLVFYCLPTINILVRLLLYFIAYLLPYGKNCVTERCCKKLNEFWRYVHRVFRMDILDKESIERPEQISVTNRVVQLFVILVCFITILSCVVLAMECIVFVVEIIMYTLIGLIVNASETLKYITLAVLLGFYARDCFGTVSKEYHAYNKFLNQYLVDKMRDKVEKISEADEDVQRNTAFQVSLDDTTGEDDKPVVLRVNGNSIQWEVKRLILFLDKNDTPYITSKFFFDTCYLKQEGVPGPLISSLLRATNRFLIICVFLFFVVVVILAFGEEYGLSATNQMFATLAGGFLPYILRFVLFKDPVPVTVDPNNLSFKSKFQKQIEEYCQIWTASDIKVDSKSEKLTSNNGNQNGATAVIDDETKSKDNIILEEIKPIVPGDKSEQVDIIIFEQYTV